MLTVSIRMAHTTVPVKQDILVMDSTVQVRLFNQIRILKFATINFTFIQSGQLYLTFTGRRNLLQKSQSLIIYW